MLPAKQPAGNDSSLVTPPTLCNGPTASASVPALWDGRRDLGALDIGCGDVGREAILDLMPNVLFADRRPAEIEVASEGGKRAP